MVKNRPPYAIQSVDHALRLALLLKQEGPIGVTDAAKRLNVAASTAHRLFAMLMYRDFAVQTDDRRYAAGPALRTGLPTPSPVSHLRRVALPHLRSLMDRTGETVNLQVRVDDQVRFVATVESHQALRVSDREGLMLPAHLVSGSKVILAAMTDEEISRLYSQHSAARVDLPALLKELDLIRQRGFAINDQKTEEGVTAIARLLRCPPGIPCAGISLAIPSARFSPEKLPQWLDALGAAVSSVSRALDEIPLVDN